MRILIKSEEDIRNEPGKIVVVPSVGVLSDKEGRDVAITPLPGLGGKSGRERLAVGQFFFEIKGLSVQANEYIIAPIERTEV